MAKSHKPRKHRAAPPAQGTDVLTAEEIEQVRKELVGRSVRDMDAFLNQGKSPKRYGIALVVFEFDTDKGHMNYSSNANREVMMQVFRDIMGRWHEQPITPPTEH
jgi:hypothetical protein